MPIKVRCSHCEKGLGIPDKYAGQKVKCPQCRGTIKVPAAASEGERSAKRPSKAKRQPAAVASPDSDSDFLADLAGDRLSESGEIDICPRCATVLKEGTDVCHKCGHNRALGVMDEAFARKKNRTGPTAGEFMQDGPKEAWKFAKSNMPLFKNTVMVWTIFGALLGSTSFMGLEYTTRTPPKVFWSACMLLSGFALGGWYWFLSAKIVKLTMERQKKTDRINIDYFSALALGIRAVLWPFIIGAPIWLVLAGLAYVEVIPRSAWAWGGGTFYALLYTLYPIAQIHMVQRYPYKAMVLWELVRSVPSVIGPLLLFLGCAAAIFVPIGGIMWVAETYCGGINPATNEYVVKAGDWLGRLCVNPFDEKDPEQIPFFYVIVKGLTCAALAFPFAFPFALMAGVPALFLMRLNGNFGLAFGTRLGLIQKMLPGTPAGFWVRFLAGATEVIAIPFAGVVTLQNPQAATLALALLGGTVMSYVFQPAMTPVLCVLWLVYSAWLYFAVGESSSNRSTIGKENFGLIVTDEEGKQLSLKQATKRFLGSTFALLALGAGFALCAIHPEKKALQDLMSKSMVVYKGDR